MESNNNFINKVSLALSAIFSPLLVPTYAYLLAVWLTVVSYAPERARLVSSIIVFLIVTALPMGIIIFLMRIGKVSDTAIDKREERFIPFVCTICCYLAAALYLSAIHAPFWLKGFYMGAAAIGAISMFINRWWKISAHAGSMGGICGALYFIAYHGYGVVPMLAWIIGAVIISGMVGSARVYLGRHTLGQVLAGWLLGAVAVYAIMCI